MGMRLAWPQSLLCHPGEKLPVSSSVGLLLASLGMLCENVFLIVGLKQKHGVPCVVLEASLPSPIAAPAPYL